MPSLAVLRFVKEQTIGLQDDHLVHRGHGVFDTALVIDGQIYMLDRHIERLANSAMQVSLHGRRSAHCVLLSA